MIEGREPEAPSVTPDTGPVSRFGTHVPAGGGVPGADGPVAGHGQFSGAGPAAEAGPAAGAGLAAGPEQEAGDGPAADLGAIRRSDAIIEMLASRRRPSRRARRDPVVAMLSGLAADVDAAPCRAASRPVTGAARQPGHARRTGYIGRAGYDRRAGIRALAGSPGRPAGPDGCQAPGERRGGRGGGDRHGRGPGGGRRARDRRHAHPPDRGARLGPVPRPHQTRPPRPLLSPPARPLPSPPASCRRSGGYGGRGW